MSDDYTNIKVRGFNNLISMVLGEQKVTPRPLHVIAKEIKDDWKNVYFGAKPYLEAMATLSNIQDMFCLDDGKDIVIRFLCNASSWRGEKARAIKKELNAMIK
jgi:hypothetical protein